MAFAVTIHKCQGLSLDCAMMELSDDVFCPGMAYVALSRVKRLKNLHLIAFKPESVMVSQKCLQEVNHLRLTYRPDLPQCSWPATCTQKRKRTMAGVCNSEPSSMPNTKQVKTNTRKRKAEAMNAPSKSTCEALNMPHAKCIKTSTRKRKAESINVPSKSISGNEGVPALKRVELLSPGADVHKI